MGLMQFLLSLISGGATDGRTGENTDTKSQVTLRVQGPTRVTEVQISEAEIRERLGQLGFVLTRQPGPLQPAEKWWDEQTQKKRQRAGAETRLAWLSPFVSPDIAKLPQCEHAAGPGDAGALMKALRSLIRERRKAGETYGELLRGLYGLAVMSDFVASLEFEGMRGHTMVGFVDIALLAETRFDYAALGYQANESLGKTDVKWLVDVLGEPREHESIETVFGEVRQDAIARYCWTELGRFNGVGAQQPMHEWLRELVTRNMGYHKEWQQRVAERQARLAASAAGRDAAWAATRGEFIVADLETTGLRSEEDEILELAAVRVNASGDVLGELEVLVKVAHLPPEITNLTGIDAGLVALEGRPLTEGIKAFAGFAGSAPVFFHNAPFDFAFLGAATKKTGVKLTNSVYDTLPLTRQAWPGLSTYRLEALARKIGVSVPTHRALADAKACLAVLLAARRDVGNYRGEQEVV